MPIFKVWLAEQTAAGSLDAGDRLAVLQAGGDVATLERDVFDDEWASQEEMNAAVIAAGNVPLGGDENQLLGKASDDDNDVEWKPSRAIFPMLSAESGYVLDLTEFDATPSPDDPGGDIWFGEARRSATTGGRIRPRGAGVIRSQFSAQHPASSFWHSLMSIFDIDEIPEQFFVRASGKYSANEMAISPFESDIADVTALSGATLVLREEYSLGDVNGMDGGYGTGEAWRTSGTLQVQSGGGHVAELTYTGRNDLLHALTGVTYVASSLRGSAAFSASSTVVYKYLTASTLGRWHAMADMGKGGTQLTAAKMSVVTEGDHKQDGYTHYYAAGGWSWGTTTIGPFSHTKDQMGLGARGLLTMFGSDLLSATATHVGRKRRIFGTHGATTAGSGEEQGDQPDQTIPNPASGYWILCRDPNCFPEPGVGEFPATIYLRVVTSSGTEEIGYTSIGVGDNVTVDATGAVSSAGQWYFKGCSGGTIGATIDWGANIFLSYRNWHTVVGGYGNISAYDLNDSIGTIARATIGAVGPGATTLTPGEGGIRAGRVGQSPVEWWRSAANVWSTNASVRHRQGTAVPGTGGAVAALAPIAMYSTDITIEATTNAPTHARAKGSICINTGGTSGTTRVYVNTDGSTGWTSIATAA